MISNQQCDSATMIDAIFIIEDVAAHAMNNCGCVGDAFHNVT